MNLLGIFSIECIAYISRIGLASHNFNTVYSKTHEEK